MGFGDARARSERLRLMVVKHVMFLAHTRTLPHSSGLQGRILLWLALGESQSQRDR